MCETLDTALKSSRLWGVRRDVSQRMDGQHLLSAWVWAVMTPRLRPADPAPRGPALRPGAARGTGQRRTVFPGGRPWADIFVGKGAAGPFSRAEGELQELLSPLRAFSDTFQRLLVSTRGRNFGGVQSLLDSAFLPPGEAWGLGFGLPRQLLPPRVPASSRGSAGAAAPPSAMDRGL